MNPNLKRSISKFALAALLGLPCAAYAAVQDGDYEVRLDSGHLIQVSVTGTTPKSRSFSGTVSFNGQKPSFKGSLTPPEEQDSENPSTALVADVAAATGIPPFSIEFTPADVENEIPESLNIVLSSAEGESFSLQGLKPVVADAGQTAISRNLISFFRLDPSFTEESLQEQVDGLSQEIEQTQASAQELDGQISMVSDELTSKKTELSTATKAFQTESAKAVYKNLASAQKAFDAASASYEKLTTANGTALNTALLTVLKKYLPADQLPSTDDLSAFGYTLLSAATVGFESATSGSETAAAFANNAKIYISALKAFLTAASGTKYSTSYINDVSPWEDFISQSEFGDFVGGFQNLWGGFSLEDKSGNPNPARKAILSACVSVIGKQLDGMSSYGAASYNLSSLQGQVDTTTLDDLKLTMESVQAMVAETQASYDDLQTLKAAIASQVKTLQEEKARLEASLPLLKYRGYGNALLAVSGNATATKPATAPIAVAFAGTSPDGQAWTYSGKLRQATGGLDAKVFLETLSGKLPLRGDIAAQITSSEDPSTDSVSFPASGESALEWSSLPCTGDVYSAPVSAGGKNLFGKSEATDVVVSFNPQSGEDSQKITGFGAEIGVTNAVSKLRVAKKGSTLALDVKTSSFSGNFPFGSTTPVPFKGFLASTEDENGPSTIGYGCLISGKASYPVELYPSPPSGDSITDPQAPNVGTQTSWAGLKTGAMKFTLEDEPTELHITKVRLLDANGKALAVTEADENGSFSFSTIALKAGNYILAVAREFISGTSEEVQSDQFELIQKQIPAATFQTLVKINPGAESGGTLKELIPLAPDGNPIRGRVTVTLTAAGAYSGKLELVRLSDVVDQTNEPAPTNSISPSFYPQPLESAPKLPVLATYTLKGDLTSDPNSSGLATPYTVLDTKSPFGFRMTMPDFETEETPKLEFSFFSESTDPETLDEVPAAAFSAVALKSVDATTFTAAKGIYKTAAEGYASSRLGNLYSFDYSKGGSTVSYAINKITGSATIDMDGWFGVFVPPQKTAPGKIKTTQNKDSTLVSVLYGGMEASLNFDDGSSVYSINGQSPYLLTGCMLETSKSGGIYNTNWNLDAYNTSTLGDVLGARAYAETLIPAYRSKDLAEVFLSAGSSYTLQIQARDGSPFGDSLSPTFKVTLDPKTKLPASGTLIGTPSNSTYKLTKLGSTNSAGTLSGALLIGKTALTLSGVYVWGDSTVARGVSSDGKYVWTLSK